MVKEIVKDAMFLFQKAEKATKEDKYIANDLLDTLKYELNFSWQN